MSFQTQLHFGQSKRRVTAIKVIEIFHWKAPPRFSSPIRVGPELQDDVTGCLLKDDRVEGKATEEGLHLEALQVTETVRRAFAKKLGKGVNARHKSETRE